MTSYLDEDRITGKIKKPLITANQAIKLKIHDQIRQTTTIDLKKTSIQFVLDGQK